MWSDGYVDSPVTISPRDANQNDVDPFICKVGLIPLVLVCLNCELCNPNIGCVRSAQKYLSLDLYSILSLFTLLLKIVSDGDEQQQQKTLFH
jgi:hypothetical protein